MKLKGTMVMELTDTNTGDVETITEENMVTNAVNHLLGINPMAAMYNAAGEYDGQMIWNNEMLPICPNMIGGILLFPKAVTENADNIYLSSDNFPVAYASNDVNATANTKRGSMNLTESKALENGYRFVWEFTPSQGNGTIAAVGLTSKHGGANAYGSDVAVDTPFLQARKISLDLPDAMMEVLFKVVEVDFENNLLYAIGYASNTVQIYKYRIPVFNIGLNEKLDDSTLTLLDETVLQCSTFMFYGSYTPYGDFIDGQDGYWYGFSNQQNSSGNATMLWIKIRKSDLTFTEGSWTLSNVAIPVIGSYKYESYPTRIKRAVVRNGYLYIPAYDKTGIYKINLSNSTDVTKIDFGFTSAMKPLGGSGNCENYLVLVGDIIIGWDFQITVNDTVVQTAGTARLEAICTAVFQYREYIFFWSSSYLDQYRMTYILTPYLATINNLSQAVVKNADKTMKITYTLTEQESSS
ncbi:hypothetical protein ACDL92_07295 [Ihubacter sp. mB4P-1]|uniref:hypothetical protein n=1 Tax=Ihubacter sp. mB4P-1 TaxID=3242370 RepID=UPI003C7B4541